MTLLQRYIFKSLMLTSFLAMGVFAFVLIVGNVLRDVVGLLADGQLSLLMFVKLIGLLVPYVVAYALPLGILTGVLLILGRLSAQNEITAMRSAGMSLFQIAAPVFFFALLGVAFTVVVNFHYAPTARDQYREDLRGAVRQNPLNFIVEKQFVRAFPGYIVYVGDKEGENLRDLWIWELNDERMVSKFLRAEGGSLGYDEETQSLLLTVEHGYSGFRDSNDPENLRDAPSAISFESTRILLPLDQILGERTSSKRLSYMNFREVMAERERFMPHSVEAFDVETFASLIRVQMDIQERFAMAFSILSLTLIGIPLGIRIQRKETSASLVIALCLALAFYFTMIAVGWFEKEPDMRPDLLIWLPNLSFQALGIWLFLRVEKR
ncbi:MAG: LptF/LptG family permease [Opitutales bacterium]